jgi:hypothetical protein
MGKSITINCIGLSDPDSDGWMREYHAMNRIEVLQETAKAIRAGRPIKYWYAQTNMGVKVLNAGGRYEAVNPENVPTKRLVTCPVCGGVGVRVVEDWTGCTKPVHHSCVVCNGSGLTTKGNEKNWLYWQIEAMKKEFSDCVPAYA